MVGNVPKIIDYLKSKEREGYTIKVDPKEDNEHGLIFEVTKKNGQLEFVGLIGPKYLGEWIRIHNAAA